MAAVSCVPALLVISFISLSLIPSVNCWDNDDLELFDLVEEVNQNFYELFGIDQGATTSEVRKAYRRLSLRHHPDKSDAENAEEKFRQIVAIYETLKDATKREKYNRVLIDGLPDWQQPVYYYRRARKMGLWELAIVLFIISIIGQYCVGWAMYIERRLAVEDMLSSANSKKKKKGKKVKSEEIIEEEDFMIPTPTVLGLWPFTLTVFTVKSVILGSPSQSVYYWKKKEKGLIDFHFYDRVKLEDFVIPTRRVLGLWPFALTIFTVIPVYYLPSMIREWKEEKQLMKEEEERQRIFEEKLREQERVLVEEMARKPKKKAPAELPEYSHELYANFSSPIEGQKTNPVSGLAEELEKAAMVQERFGEEWTDEELMILNKAVRKFPAGVPERWEKIADMVGRSVIEVTNKSKEIRGGLGFKPNTNMQDITNTKSSLKISDEIITQNAIPEEDEDEMDYDNIKVRKRKKQSKNEKTEPTSEQKSDKVTKNVEKNSESKSDGGAEATKVLPDGWTQNQQTIFEWALKQYPKGTDKRWDLVAEHIPGKSKEDCITRFKELAELISKKKKMDLVSKSKSS